MDAEFAENAEHTENTWSGDGPVELQGNAAEILHQWVHFSTVDLRRVFSVPSANSASSRYTNHCILAESLMDTELAEDAENTEDYWFKDGPIDRSDIAVVARHC